MLRTLHVALPEQTARADGDHRLLQVVALVRQVGRILVHEDEQAVALVLLEQLVFASRSFKHLIDHEHCHDQRDSHSQADDEIAPIRATHDERDGGNEQWNDYNRFNRHCQVQGSNNVNISQTGIEVPNGTYQVLFTGFYAPTGLGALNATDLNTYKTDGDAAVFAVGYANDATIKLPSVYSLEATESVANVHQKQVGDFFFPGNPDQANGSLGRRLYQSELLTVTVTDGLLTLGVKSVDGCPASAWIGLSDVKLYYLGQAEESLTLTVDVTDAGYATFVAPMESAVPEGVTAYTAEVNANGVTIDLTPVNPIPANTPVVLKAANGTYTFTGSKVPAVDAPTFGALTGTYSRIPAPAGSYVLQKQSDKVGFYLVDADVAIPYVNANRAYLIAPSSGVKAFFFADDATGIEMVNEIYNLAGQRMSKMQKGINIVGGKKILF